MPSALRSVRGIWLVAQDLQLTNWFRPLSIAPPRSIRDVLSLRKSDGELLKHMDKVGKRILKSVIETDSNVDNNISQRFVYHIPPCTSVPHLHLHCIAGPLTTIGKLKFNHSHTYDSDEVLKMLSESKDDRVV